MAVTNDVNGKQHLARTLAQLVDTKHCNYCGCEEGECRTQENEPCMHIKESPVRTRCNGYECQKKWDAKQWELARNTRSKQRAPKMLKRRAV